MNCGCDRIIVLNSDVKFPSNDGLTYLDLYDESTFDQIDSLVELNPGGKLKTEAIIGGSIPATPKNKAILDLRINPKDQKLKPLKVVAMNGHKTLNVNSLRVVHYDEESFEIEITRDETHWAVCASELKLHTLDLEEYELTAEFVSETWDNYSYEDGDIGVYYPLAYYGDVIRETEWIAEDLRPAHSIPFLLKEGFAQCGWDFSSPIFETDIGKRLWIYAIGEDYGQDDLDPWKAKAIGTPGKNEVSGQLLSYGDDVYRSKFVGIAEFTFTLDIQDQYFSAGIANQPAWFDLRVYRQTRDENNQTKNILIEKYGVDYPAKDNENSTGEYVNVISWASTLTAVPGDEILIQVTYMTARNVENVSLRHLIEVGSTEPIINNDHIAQHKYTLTVTPIRRFYTKGDTVNVAGIIDKELTLMTLLKGVSHLFGQAKLYINNTTREIRMYPPYQAKWGDEIIEGFFKYDETMVLNDGIIKDSLEVVGAEITTTRYHRIGYKKGNNPYFEGFDRKVDFDNPQFDDETTEWLNPSFNGTISRKLIRDTSVRPPLLPEVANDGIEMMYLVDNESGDWSFNIGLVPFIAYGNYYSYGEVIDDEFKYSFFRFEGKWYDIPVSGQKPNFQTLKNNEPKDFTPWLIYGEEPLKDLFSIFWREYFYKESLVSAFNINVAFSSKQLKDLDYRKLYFIQYAEGFAAWLNRREFNYCTPEGTRLSFIGDISIEPESIDPETIPPIEEPCTKQNTPEIEWSLSDECMLTYSQIGTIESNITSDEWLLRYEGETSFEPAPPSPFNPDKNLYLRYKANTDDEDCTIPPVTVFINVCSVNKLEAEVTYNELTDCYKIQQFIEGCNTYNDVEFQMDMNGVISTIEPSNPTDPVEEWYVEVCEPEDDFCITIIPTVEEGCEIESTSVCINLCPKKEDIECIFTEGEGGFSINPQFNIHKPIQSTLIEYDFDPEFPYPKEVSTSDVLTMVGKVYFRITLEFTDCPDLVVVCEYERSSQDCGLNTPDFECVILPDGRLNIVRTGTLVTEVAVDLIRYRAVEQQEWQTWDGTPISRCPMYIQRIVIYCNDCPNSCSEIKFCDCDIAPPPTAADCDAFDVKLLRFSTLLYAYPTDVRNDITYVFLKDGEEVQNSFSNLYNGAIEPGSTYIVRALVGSCEAQDSFFVESDCVVPTINYKSHSESNDVYTILFETESYGTVTVTHTYQVDAVNNSTVSVNPSISGGNVEVSLTLRPGDNRITARIENECGVGEDHVVIDIVCPVHDAGLPKSYRICEGCYNSLDLITLLDGTPDQGGVWIDVDATDKLSGGILDASSLVPGVYQFLYVVGEGICAEFATVYIEVIEEKSAGENTQRTICHDDNTIDLLSWISGNPDAGGIWFSEDYVGGLDLENGTYTPSIDDVGTTITIAYSHTPIVDPIPNVADCSCDRFSILTLTVEDCTPPPPCPDDSGLGITINEVTNNSPNDSQWEDKLVISKTGSYEDGSIIESDDIYFSFDDGDTWIKGDEVKDSDYYDQLLFGFNGGDGSGGSPTYYQWSNVRLVSGGTVDMVRLTTGGGAYNTLEYDVDSGYNLRVQGSSYNITTQRTFYFQVHHELNSGWVLEGMYYLMTAGRDDLPGLSQPGSPVVRTIVHNKVSGKKKIHVERRISYNNGCDPIAIEGIYNPDIPECPTLPPNVGITVTPPQGGFQGTARCQGTVTGQTSSRLYSLEYETNYDRWSVRDWVCGSPGPFDGSLSVNNKYYFTRVIHFDGVCPPIIVERDYQSPTVCNVVAQLQCHKDDDTRVAWANRLSTPPIVSSDYLQYRIGTGSWLSYSNNQLIPVGSSAANVQFRRVANYNNGCPQTTDTCSVSFSGLPQPQLSISCALSGTQITINASNLPPGGMYRIYRNNALFRTQSNPAPVNISSSGSYRVEYDYTYISNTIQCGVDPCSTPTVIMSGCSQSNGSVRVDFIATEMSSGDTITVNTSPNTTYDLTFNSVTGNGYVILNSNPGTVYNVSITAENSCGSGSDSITCSSSCTTLTIENVQCDYVNNRVTYDVRTSPASSTRPTSNGTYVSTPSNGVYRYRLTGTSGTITADHSQACTSVSQVINCDCPLPHVDLDIWCDVNTIYVNPKATNIGSITSDYEMTIDGIEVILQHNGNPNFTTPMNFSGLSHTYTFKYKGCGQIFQESGSINCDCSEPSINLTASCSGTTVSYSFTVNNENNITSNYTIKNNNQTVATVNRTGSGSYSGTIPVDSGSNNQIKIEASNKCGGIKSSNTVSANCACPPSTLTITNLSCDSNTQEITFNVNQSNVSNVVLKVNGSTKTITSNPQTVQGSSGNNIVELTGVDSCSNAALSDSRTVNCQCTTPSIDLTASCNNSGVISFSFNVTNESQATGNYELLIDGSNKRTITRTGAGTYSGTYTTTPGSSHSVRIRIANKCGSTTQSNTVNTSCGCPPSTLTISNASCSSSTQVLTFNVNSSNISNRELRVNGSVVAITGNPQTVQGQIGSNTITVTGQDTCSGSSKTDSITLNCACVNTPTVSLGSATVSGSNLSVQITTSHIDNVNQIQFIANGTNRQVVKSSNNNFSVTFPAQSGINNYSVTVTNSCGQDTASGSYNYTPCVPPTITKVNEQNMGNGRYRVTFSKSNCESISVTPSNRVVGTVNCNSSYVEFDILGGSQSFPYTITVNGCNSTSDSISGTINPCGNCTATISNMGCTSTSQDADLLFMVDTSGSITQSRYEAIQATIRSTINYLNNQSSSYRYAVGEYRSTDTGVNGERIKWIGKLRSGNYFNTYANIQQDIALGTWVRTGHSGCAEWDSMFQGIDLVYNAGRLTRRSGAKLHLIVLHDSDNKPCSEYGSYALRNAFLQKHLNADISVVRFEDTRVSNSVDVASNMRSAAMATVGGSWGVGSNNCAGFPNNCIDTGNFSDPRNGDLPRRMYYFLNPTGTTLTDLAEDISSNCRLGGLGSCPPYSANSLKWVASNGGQIIGADNLVYVDTNGVGKYTLTITTTTGCSAQASFDYSLQYTKKVYQAPSIGTEAPTIKKASEYIFDYSGLTESDNEELLDLINNKLYKKIMHFYNTKVKSGYFFSCSCDEQELDSIVKKYLHGLGLL